MLLGRQHEILLTDFGIATIAQNTSQQRTQGVAGTAAYMAPEQLQGKPRQASDLYSLGVVVYEWLCGERPFQGGPIEVATQHVLTPPPPLHDKVPSLSREVEQVVLTALAKDPKERFASVQAFARAFAGACQMEEERGSASPVPVLLVPTGLAPVRSEGWETWVLQAPTQLSAPPPGAETARESVVGRLPEPARSAPELAPITPVVTPPVESSLLVPTSETSDQADVRSMEPVPQAPGRRSPARVGRLAATGLSAGLIVVLVAALLLTRVLPHGTQTNSPATATAESRAATGTALASAATATAQFNANAPYSAPVPGPGCDKGTGQWTVDHPEGVQCLPDRLRLIGEPDTNSGGYKNAVSFSGPYPRYPFSPDFMVSVEVSGISGSGGAGLYRVPGSASGGWGFYIFLYPGGGWIARTHDAASNTDLYTVQGSFDPVATNSITITVRGATVSFELNGQQVGAYQGSGPPSGDVICWMIVQGMTAERVQTDFQNFVYTPLH